MDAFFRCFVVLNGHARSSGGDEAIPQKRERSPKSFPKESCIGSVCFVFQFQPLKRPFQEIGTQQQKYNHPQVLLRNKYYIRKGRDR